MTARLAVWQYGPRGETEVVHVASSGESVALLDDDGEVLLVVAVGGPRGIKVTTRDDGVVVRPIVSNAVAVEAVPYAEAPR